MAENNNRLNFKYPRRNYYTNSGFPSLLKASENNISNQNFSIDFTTPAGIPPRNQNETAVTFIEPSDSGTTIKSDVVYENTPQIPSPSQNSNYPNINYPNTDTLNNNRSSNNSSEYLNSYVRFYNLISNNGEVNIFINGDEVVSNLDSMNVSNYVGVAPGIYQIDFYSADNPNNIIYEYRNRSLPGMKTTLAITSSGSMYSVTDVSGSSPECLYNTAYLRFIQTAANAPAMDIFVDGIQVIAGITYGEVSGFIGIPQGVHNIRGVASGTGINYINENLKFTSSSVSNMFISSGESDNFILSVLGSENVCSNSISR